MLLIGIGMARALAIPSVRSSGWHLMSMANAMSSLLKRHRLPRCAQVVQGVAAGLGRAVSVGGSSVPVRDVLAAEDFWEGAGRRPARSSIHTAACVNARHRAWLSAKRGFGSMVCSFV